MSAGELAFALLVWPLLGGLVVTFGLVRWGRWLGGKYGAARWIRWVVPSGAAVCALICGWSTRSGIRMLEDSADDSLSEMERQRASMNAVTEINSAVLHCLGIFALVALVLLALTWKYHWRAKTPATTGSPPYR